ncbi:unnamed protein product [Rhizophagus irregularis]|nr:unnamed protein product [Rhizophagus irregularis]
MNFSSQMGINPVSNINLPFKVIVSVKRETRTHCSKDLIRELLKSLYKEIIIQGNDKGVVIEKILEK